MYCTGTVCLVCVPAPPGVFLPVLYCTTVTHSAGWLHVARGARGPRYPRAQSSVSCLCRACQLIATMVVDELCFTVSKHAAH